MPRFFKSPYWHLLVTDRDSNQITFLDRLATNRGVRYELGGPAQFQGSVPADSPEINILHTDGFTTGSRFPDADYPFLDEGLRFLYALRKDRTSTPNPIYEARFGGIIQQMDDTGDTESPLSNFTAFDPWQYLMSRPCLNRRVPQSGPSEAFDLPGDMGTVFLEGTTLNFVATELLRRTISEDGTVHIDAGDGTRIGEGAQYDDWGGTDLYAGTIEECATLAKNLIFAKGTSVGEAWRQLVDTGGIDIVLRAIYDPDRPGYLVEFNCYVPENFDYGQTSYQQVTWDRSGHAVTEMVRSIDGTERANKIRVFGPMDAPRPTVTSTRSITRFGKYWNEIQVERYRNNQTLDGMANRELIRQEKGRRTWKLALAPEWDVIPFRDVDLGYDVCLYHSNRLRQETWECHRVLGFTLALGETEGEQMTDLLLSTDDEYIAQP